MDKSEPVNYNLISTVFTRIQVEPVYKSTPILEPKNRFFLFLGKNFLEKLILYFLEFSFRYYGYMKKNYSKFGREVYYCVYASVLATRVSSTIFEISLQNQTYYFLTNLYRYAELQSRFRRQA